MLKQQVKRLLAVVMLASITTFAFADDAAPVFDVDNFPPQFDDQPDPGESAQAHPYTTQSGNRSTQRTAPAPQLSTEQRVTRVEQQVNNLQHAELSPKVDVLQHDLQTLRGQVEELTHQLQQLQTQSHTMYSDLDKRLTERTVAPTKAPRPANAPDDTILPDQTPAHPAKSKQNAKEAAASTKTAATPAAATTDQQPNVAEEQQIYQTAYDLIKAKKYNEAITALQKMLQKYPSGQFAANAHYWLGELYGLLNKNDQSAVEFANVVKNYPDSPKVSDAQLKLGLIYAAQFKWSDAKGAFKKVINHYPGTASARLAAEQLKQIKEAGH